MIDSIMKKEGNKMKKLFLSIALFAFFISGYGQTLPNIWVPTSGTNTYTTNITGFTSSYNNKIAFVRFTNANSGASTININSLGAAPLRIWNGSAWVALSSGDIKTDRDYRISYDNTNSYFRLEVIETGGGGSGTVTSVSVTTANGVSGSVANATTTPAITLTLGAITPSTVNGVTVSGSSSPTLSVTGTTAVSGTNTGDQIISDATISTTDITTNNVTTTKHGFTPKLPNDATRYLDGTGAYTVPPGTGGISGLTTNGVAVATSPTAIGTYSDLSFNPTQKALYIGDAITPTGIRIHQGGTPSNNTFGGKNSGNFTLTGNSNAFWGAETGLDATTMARTVLNGYAAGDVCQSCTDDVFIGFTAGNTMVNNHRDVIVGAQSSNSVQKDDLTLLGYNNGQNSGNNCAVVGSQADVGVPGNNDQLSIQNIIYGQSNSGTGSTASTGRIGIGVKNPLTKLHVDGELRLGTTATAGDQTISVASSTTDANLILTPQGTGSVKSRFTGVPTSTLAGLDMGSFAGIPSGIANGQMVYNTTANEAIVRINGVNTAINKATQLTGTVPTASGGTGLTTIGTAGQSLVVNAGGTALEYQTVAGGSSWATTGNTNITTPTITGVPTFIGHNVIQTNGLGNTQTNTSGLVLDNTTDALVGAQQQFSPAVRFRGRAYVTGGGTSQTIDFRLDNYTNAGTSAPSGFLRIGTSVNGAAYADQYLFGNDGTVYIGATSGSVNITGAGSSLVCQNWYSGNNNIKFSLRLPTGSITTGLEFTAPAGNINSTTYTGLKYTGGTYAHATGTGSHTTFSDNSVINTTGSFTGTRYGFDSSPTMTSSTGLTNYAYHHASGFVAWNSSLSPAQITANQDNYNPTGWNNGGAPHGASILILTTDASRNLTSLTGGVNGRLAIILNAGSNNLVIKDDDGSTGTAANRFDLNADNTLLPGESTMIWYDGAASRWRAIK